MASKLATVAWLVLVAAMMAMAVSAVDIVAYSGSGCSGGVIRAFPSQADGVCAPFPRLAVSVRFRGLSRCKRAIVYSRTCSTIKAFRSGLTGSFCFSIQPYTAGRWRTIVGCRE